MYRVTFEAPDRHAPETIRGLVYATSPAIACKRAVAEASRGRRRRWDDILVLIERAPHAAQGADAAREAA